ncbi:hypothetical protein NQZ79_g750 [Umbelopsis isabellina]|nr:hypothetical protein NQZ79_g750 [Umbelopsis isabellina]
MLEEDNSQTGNNSASEKSPEVPADELTNDKTANLAESGPDSAYLTPDSSDDPESTAIVETGEQEDQLQAANGEIKLGTPALLQVPNDGTEEQSTATQTATDEQSQGPSLEQRLADSVAISAPKANTAQQSNNVQRTSSFSANPITTGKINLKTITANTLGPREQEAADEPVLRGIHHLFNNRFSQAKKIFEDKADKDPLYSLGLGSMAFLIASMSASEHDINIALETLTNAYNIATAQINATKTPLSERFSNYYRSMTTSKEEANTQQEPQAEFLSNGTMRAHVIVAESCLQTAILQFLQESMFSYMKGALNLKRSYKSYNLAWQEFKKMGQEAYTLLDEDTISGIQFGIGSIHLLLPMLPTKVLKVVATFGWTPDRPLGISMLKECAAKKRIRAPMAASMLLAYYSILTTFAPQVLAADNVQPAIETLLESQQVYPNSSFFLFFAGYTSRLTKNITLASQSFEFARDIAQGELAAVEFRLLSQYEMAYNYLMTTNWQKAAEAFSELQKEKYWSEAFCKFAYGACLEALGERTDAILAFAEVPHLVPAKKRSKMSGLDAYAIRKVETYQASGYQDMDFTMSALEILCINNLFCMMEPNVLHDCLKLVDKALENIIEREKQEYEIRMRELAPGTAPPNYFDQRGTLLLIKSSILNSLHYYRDSILHLNWIIDHGIAYQSEKWLVPFACWEAGVTTWGLEEKGKSIAFWDRALTYTKYDFEYRLTLRVNLAIERALEQGVQRPAPNQPDKGPSTNGRSRMPKSTSSTLPPDDEE